LFATRTNSNQQNRKNQLKIKKLNEKSFKSKKNHIKKEKQKSSSSRKNDDDVDKLNQTPTRSKRNHHKGRGLIL
jgi:hypothetical protein